MFLTKFSRKLGERIWSKCTEMLCCCFFFAVSLRQILWMNDSTAIWWNPFYHFNNGHPRNLVKKVHIDALLRPELLLLLLLMFGICLTRRKCKFDLNQYLNVPHIDFNHISFVCKTTPNAFPNLTIDTFRLIQYSIFVCCREKKAYIHSAGKAQNAWKHQNAKYLKLRNQLVSCIK